MEERRSNGFRVKPSFGQVLGYIQEGEPLTLDLPNRKASIYTSSHWYLDDYPNAPEPLSDAPLPHTTLNPAAAFETADEGYDGVPFPRPPREFTRPSFLPDSYDGGTDPGQALRNDGLNPPRPPTLGGRMRESGIQAAEAIVAGGAAGAAAAVRSVSENQTMLALRGGGDWLDRTLRIPRRPPGLAPPPDEVPAPQIIGRPSEVEALLERAGQRAVEVERAAAQDIESFASQQLAEAEASEGFATAAEAAAGAAEAAAAAEGGGMLAALGEGALAAAGTVGAATGGLNAASHLMGWGAATGGGTDSDASRPSMTTDVQTLNGELQRVKVSCRGEGPGVLEGQDLRVVPVQAGVPEGQRGVHRGLLDEREQGRRDELAHVCGRGPESHSGGEVAGADQGEQSRGDGLGDVACRLAGRHVQS